MKPAPFAYEVPRSIGDALALLAESGGDAQILAGGQSLVPMLALRMAAPAMLIDINRIEGLRRIEENDDALVLGACVRHADLLRYTAGKPEWSLIADCLHEVAHPGVRNRGTVCGSLALADPAAEAPAYALALDAEIHLVSLRGERRVAAEDFFQGIYETAREPDEMVVAVSFPRPAAAWRFGFEEIARRRGDYALAGLCAGLRIEEGRIEEARLVYFGVSDRPRRARSAEALMLGLSLGEARAAALAGEAAAAEIPVSGSPDYSAGYKRHLVGVLTERVLTQLSAGEGA